MVTMDSTSIILGKFPPHQEYLLQILHELQAVHPQNFLEQTQLEQVAAYLNLNKSTVLGVAQYYSMLSTVPQGKHQLRVCCSVVCSNAGSCKLLRELSHQFKGQEEIISVAACECLGQCDHAPSVQFDRTYMHGDDIKALIKLLNNQLKKDHDA